jgi:hypothetical protein
MLKDTTPDDGLSSGNQVHCQIIDHAYLINDLQCESQMHMGMKADHVPLCSRPSRPGRIPGWSFRGLSRAHSSCHCPSPPQTFSNSCSGLKGYQCNQCSAVHWSLPSRPKVPAYNVRWTFHNSLLDTPPPRMQLHPQRQPCNSAPKHWRNIQFDANARKRCPCKSLISCMTIRCPRPVHDTSDNQ